MIDTPEFKEQLEEAILRYEATAPSERPEYGLMSDEERTTHLAARRDDPVFKQRMVDAAVIGFAAEYFYGISATDYSSFADLINAIRNQGQ